MDLKGRPKKENKRRGWDNVRTQSLGTKTKKALSPKWKVRVQWTNKRSVVKTIKNNRENYKLRASFNRKSIKPIYCNTYTAIKTNTM